MNPEIIAFLLVALLFLGMAVGLPIGIALGVSGFLGLWWILDWNFAMSALETLPFNLVANYSWAVFPLFILVGNLAMVSGLSTQVFQGAHLLLGRFKGGLYLVVIAGSAGFAAASGSTIVNAVVFTRVALPEMLQYGYSLRLSLGSIAAAGTFAAMIPPSLTMVIYAVITEQSIGKMLLAGIIPGILSALLYVLLIIILVRIKPELSPLKTKISATRLEKKAAWEGISILFILIFIIMGGIYAGFFPPSQAGAAAAFFILIYTLLKKNKPKGWLKKSLTDSTAIASTIFLILIGGALFSRMIALSGIVESFIFFIQAHIHSATGVLILFSLMYIVLGSFLDTASMMIITLPFVFPVITAYNINPIWFGVIFVKLIEIAVITPPVGLNLYAVFRAAKQKARLQDVVWGVLPFLLVDFLTLGILIALPALSLYFPMTLGK